MTETNPDSRLPNPKEDLFLPMTGERLIPEVEQNSSNYQVHFSRYVYAQQLVNRDSEILDYGCGTGYGLQHLAQFTFKRCIGIDKHESIEYAKQRYPAENASYIAGDLTSPNARYGKFDLVVSFDVIEHVSSIDMYLENIAAQLRNSASIALISTPWSFRRNNVLPMHNPYHMCELTVTEFFNQLDPYFQIDDILLTLGMMARVKLKDSNENNLSPMSISLSGEHMSALEESIEDLSQRVESLEILAEAVEDVSRRMRENREEYRLPHSMAPVLYDSTDYSVQALSQNTKILTHFVAEGDNLSAIDVPLTAYDRLTGSEIRLSLFRDKVSVASITIPGILILEGHPQRFLFPPIPKSEGIRFSLVLEIPPERFDSPIGVWCDSHNRPLLQAYYRRYRWDGAPHYTTTTEFISVNQTLPKTSSTSKHPMHLSTQHLRGATSILPTVDERPWSVDAPKLKKLSLSLKHYGVAATLNELMAYLRWRYTGD